MTNELTTVQQRALADCLRALDAGNSVQVSLARHPEHAGALRPYLELRARLFAAELPASHPAAYQAGRQALLDRLAGRAVVEETAASPLAGLVRRWRSIGSPAVRLAAAAAAIGVLGLGALGAAAAGGVGPGRDVLSALRIVPAADDDATDSLQEQDAAGAQPTTLAPDDASEPGPPQEVPGVGLCFDGDRTPPPGLSEDVLERVPDAGLCVPEGLIEHEPEGRPCLPPGLIDRFPELSDIAGDDAVCGVGDRTPASGSDDAGPADHPTGPPGDAGPPDDSPAPTDRPHGPPDDVGEPQNQGLQPEPTPPPASQPGQHSKPPVA
jgi:hypothetical protein